MAQLAQYAGSAASTGIPDRTVLDSRVPTFPPHVRFGAWRIRRARRNFPVRWCSIFCCAITPTQPRSQEALEMVLQTLRAMANGGMHDQLGGGFHRYSVDERWFVPHFEKMLYDQAQLADFISGGVPDHARSVLRENRSEHARLRAARHDAIPKAVSIRPKMPTASSIRRNPNEKGEGAFYIWSAGGDWSSLAESLRQFLLPLRRGADGNVQTIRTASSPARTFSICAKALDDATRGGQVAAGQGRAAAGCAREARAGRIWTTRS